MRPGQPGQPGDVTENGIEHDGTEFIILFIWREPTPSAPLRKEEKPPDITAPTGPMTGGPGRLRPHRRRPPVGEAAAVSGTWTYPKMLRPPV